MTDKLNDKRQGSERGGDLAGTRVDPATPPPVPPVPAGSKVGVSASNTRPKPGLRENLAGALKAEAVPPPLFEESDELANLPDEHWTNLLSEPPEIPKEFPSDEAIDLTLPNERDALLERQTASEAHFREDVVHFLDTANNPGAFVLALFLHAGESHQFDALQLSAKKLYEEHGLTSEQSDAVVDVLRGRRGEPALVARLTQTFMRELSRCVDGISTDHKKLPWADLTPINLAHVFSLLQSHTVISPFKYIDELPTEFAEILFLALLDRLPDNLEVGEVHRFLAPFEWASPFGDILLQSERCKQLPPNVRSLLALTLGVSEGLESAPIPSKLKPASAENRGEFGDFSPLPVKDSADGQAERVNKPLEKQSVPVQASNQGEISRDDIPNWAGSKKSDASFRPIRLEGNARGRSRTGFTRVLTGVTGLSLLRFLGYLISFLLLGYRRKGRLTFDGEALVLERTIRMFGRTIKDYRDVIRPGAVSLLGKEVKYPQSPVYLGLIFLIFGVVVGMVTLLDGIRGEYLEMSLFGLGLLLVGIITDFIFSSIAANLPGKTSIRLMVGRKEFHRLMGVEARQADKLLGAVTPLLPRSARPKSS